VRRWNLNKCVWNLRTDYIAMNISLWSANGPMPRHIIECILYFSTKIYHKPSYKITKRSIFMWFYVIKYSILWKSSDYGDEIKPFNLKVQMRKNYTLFFRKWPISHCSKIIKVSQFLWLWMQRNQPPFMAPVTLSADWFNFILYFFLMRFYDPP
jgi:hypothetical protein